MKKNSHLFPGGIPCITDKPIVFAFHSGVSVTKTFLRSVLLIFIPTLLISYNLFAQWTTINSPTTDALYGVAYSNPATCVAVGDLGTIIRSIDGGNTWTTINSPIGDPLRAIAFNGDIGLAVGIGGKMIRTTDAGLTWTKLAKQTTKNLYSVTMTGTTAITTGEEGTILYSSDNGVTWSTAGAGTASILFGVSAHGNAAITVGGAGAVAWSPGGGSTWGLTVLGSALTFFYGVSLPDGITGYLAGINVTNGIVLRTDNSGVTWTTQTIPLTTNTFFGISFSSADTGTAVGTSGMIIHTDNGGTQWDTQNSGTIQTLNAIASLNSKNTIIVGDGGTILKSVPLCSASITPSGNLSACTPGSVLISADSGNGISYQWYKNSTAITGATNQTYTAKKTAIYYVKETTTSGCSATSDTLNLTVLTSPTATITPLGNLDICAAGSVDLQANSGVDLSYQWMKGVSSLAGATNQVYTVTTKGTYKVIVTSGNGCSKTSKGVKVIKTCKEDPSTNDFTEALSCYPNPSVGEFTLDLKSNTPSGSAILEIINTNGQKIYSEEIPVTSGEIKKVIETTSLSNGIYTLKVIEGDRNLLTRLLIQH